ncbi:GNAT family N-acetyltransferase [Mesorhizobium sp.]|uniref:GNAT family N-acetyltransferase n=1 Tax=Mesorhizobium sp. TaxID=1871066 RepID=UPI00338E91C2
MTQSLVELRRELIGPGLAVRADSRLIGAVRWRLDGSMAHIGRLTVAPDWQGRGIGTRLLRAAEAASGASFFELFTGHRSERNIRLYEREGYVFLRMEPINDRIELIFLRKSRT